MMGLILAGEDGSGLGGGQVEGNGLGGPVEVRAGGGVWESEDRVPENEIVGVVASLGGRGVNVGVGGRAGGGEGKGRPLEEEIKELIGQSRELFIVLKVKTESVRERESWGPHPLAYIAYRWRCRSGQGGGVQSCSHFRGGRRHALQVAQSSEEGTTDRGSPPQAEPWLCPQCFLLVR